MFTPTYTVQHQVPGSGTWTTINNIQNIQISNGRQKLSDGIRPGVATIEGRRPDLLPAINLGDYIWIRIYANPSNAAQYISFQYRVADAKTNYYYTTSGDTWTLDVEDALAFLGRASYSATWTSGQTARYWAQQVMSASGTYMDSFTAGPSALLDPHTFDEVPAATIMEKLIATDQALIVANGLGITWSSRGWQYNLATRTASDDGTGTNPATYQELIFRSMADNYADKVVVTNEIFTEASGAGNTSYAITTFSPTAAELQDIADYARQVYSLQSQTPSEITFLVNMQTNSTVGLYLMYAPVVLQELLIKFRGTTYYTIPIGSQITITPESCRARVFLMSSYAYKFLVLDDPSFGTLDYNKLGF